MSSQPRQYRYGLSTNLSVSPKAGDGQTLMLGGIGQDQRQWTHAITRRAAQVLWCKLTELLYPDKAQVVTGMAATAPLSALGLGQMTTHIEVVKTGTQYTLVGRIDRTRWLVQLTELEVRHLWATLDRVLYPVGWEGRESKHKKLN